MMANADAFRRRFSPVGWALGGPDSYSRRRPSLRVRPHKAGGGPPALAERWALGQGLPVSAGTTSLDTYLGRWLAIMATRLRPSTVRAYAIDSRRFVPYLAGSRCVRSRLE